MHYPDGLTLTINTMYAVGALYVVSINVCSTLRDEGVRMKDSIFVVVITHNGEKDIEAFLETYHAYTPEGVLLVVVDNASGDRTLDYVRDQCPEATILQNMRNRGYAGGAREGMEYALVRGAQYIAVVNQDLLFTERWLEPLVDHLESHERCAAVQPRIMMYPQTDVINSYGNAQHYLGFGYTLGYKEIFGRYTCKDGKELATCSGAATLFRTTALRDVGLIDADYFMYYEDSDLSWRLRLRGYTLALCCDSTVYHRYEFSRSMQKFYYMERNRFFLMLTNYSSKTILLILPMLAVMEVGMMCYSVLCTLRGARSTLTLSQKLRSYGAFFHPHLWRVLSKKRRDVQHQRRVSDKEITRLFVDTIEFQDVDNALLQRIAHPLMHWYWSLIRRLI